MTFFTQKDFNLEIVRGNISGFTEVEVFGRNPAVTTASDPEDIWEGGADYTGDTPTGAVTMEVVSSSASDTSAGTGMRTVTVRSLASETATAYTEQTIALNGTSPVTLNNAYRTVFVEGATYGSGETNAGTITVREISTPANIHAAVQPDNGTSNLSNFTIPSGSTGYLTRIRASITRTNGSAGSAIITLRERAPGVGGYNAIRTFDISTEGGIAVPFTVPIEIAAGTDLKARCDQVSDSTTLVNFAYDLILIED